MAAAEMLVKDVTQRMSADSSVHLNAIKAVELIRKHKSAVAQKAVPPANKTPQRLTRQQAAKILKLSPITLRNRRHELPEPAARGGRGIPLYDYGPLRKALIGMYPEKAFLLPENFSDLNL